MTRRHMPVRRSNRRDHRLIGHGEVCGTTHIYSKKLVVFSVSKVIQSDAGRRKVVLNDINKVLFY